MRRVCAKTCHMPDSLNPNIEAQGLALWQTRDFDVLSERLERGCRSGVTSQWSYVYFRSMPLGWLRAGQGYLFGSIAKLTARVDHGQNTSVNLRKATASFISGKFASSAFCISVRATLDGIARHHSGRLQSTLLRPNFRSQRSGKTRLGVLPNREIVARLFMHVKCQALSKLQIPDIFARQKL